MVTIKKTKQKFVRIKIGSSETGNKGFHAPIRTINIPDANVEEIYQILIKELKKRVK